MAAASSGLSGLSATGCRWTRGREVRILFGMPDEEPGQERNGDGGYRDALPGAAFGGVHRRAAGLNPGNRFDRTRVHIDGDELDRERREREGAAAAVVTTAGQRPRPGGLVHVPLTVLPDQTKTIIHRVESASDMPFDWTVNPYRGCEHGCIYCYARPYHEYLGFSSGLDFETKIMAKHDAPLKLVQELAKPSWKGEPIVMSAITDVYQPIEKELRITRQCLEVMADCGQPVSTMTKNTLVLRDLDLWGRLGEMGAGRVVVTLVTLDADLAARLEPRASPPAARLRVIEKLVAAGVPVGVNIAPVIPGLTDHEVPRLLEAVADAGAKRVAWVLLRLPYQLKELFLDWLERNVHPDRARHVESLIRQARGGKLYDAGPDRGRGKGPMVEQLKTVFDVYGRRYGLNRDIRPLNRTHFRHPELGGQGSLF